MTKQHNTQITHQNVATIQCNQPQVEPREDKNESDYDNGALTQLMQGQVASLNLTLSDKVVVLVQCLVN